MSTALFIAALIPCGKDTRPPSLTALIVPLIVVLITGTALVYTSRDMPPFGDAHAPAQSHVASYYLQHTREDIGIPNVVTAILASYRGFDTLGETAVVFLAALGVLLLLDKDDEEDGDKPEEEP